MNKHLPEVILFQEDEKALGYMYELAPKNQLPNSVVIKSVDYDVEDFTSSELSIIGKRPTIGSVYFLHPYKKNTYVHDSLDKNYFLAEKVDLFKRVGQLLGAKSIKTNVKLIESRKVTNAGEGKGSYALVEVEADVKTEKEKFDKSCYEISDSYILEQEFNLNKNIDELRLFINENYLRHETDLVSLIDARDSRISGTKLVTRKVKSELSSEYNSLLETSLSIKNPIFTASANFNRNVETLNVLTIDIDYEF